MRLLMGGGGGYPREGMRLLMGGEGGYILGMRRLHAYAMDPNVETMLISNIGF